MKNLIRMTPLWLGAVVVLLAIGSVWGGYFFGQKSAPKAEAGAESIWEVDSAAVSRRSITVKGEVSDVLANSIVVQARNEKTGAMDLLAIPVDSGTQTYLTIRRDGQSEAPALISLSQVKVGDRADAVIDIGVAWDQKTTSLAIWRDL